MRLGALKSVVMVVRVRMHKLILPILMSVLLMRALWSRDRGIRMLMRRTVLAERDLVVGEQPLSLNKSDDFSKTDAFPEVAHHEWAFASHLSRVALHYCERSADVGSKVHLVNYQQIGLGDARAALARNLFAARYVDHVNGQVGKLRAESGSKIVAPRFNKHDVGIGVFLQHAIDSFQIN